MTTRHLCQRSSAFLLAGLLLVSAPRTVSAQVTFPPSNVRQIVTFLFQPGRSAEAMAIYEQQLKPIYADIPAMRQFRAYRETESPEPLDLVVISSYDNMAGMDAANEGLRRPGASGKSALALYGTLSAMTQSHHDQFVEMIPMLSDSASDSATLTVFEYIRLAPGAQASFEVALKNAVRPFEQSTRSFGWSETGRMLVADGWDYVRVFGIQNLGDWQRYQDRVRTAGFNKSYSGLIAARKTMILRLDPRLSVR